MRQWGQSNTRNSYRVLQTTGRFYSLLACRNAGDSQKSYIDAELEVTEHDWRSYSLEPDRFLFI